MPQGFPEMIRLFVMVFGNAMYSHLGFLEDLTLSPDLREVKTLDESDVIIAFVPIVSRAGTDIEAALKEIPESQPVVLVALHHTDDPGFVAPDSRLCVNRSTVFTVDCLFHEDRGLLRCHRNDEAVKAVKKHLGVEEAYFEDRIRFSNHPSKLNKVTQQALQQCRRFQWELLVLFTALIILAVLTYPPEDVIPWMFALACFSLVYTLTPSEYIHSVWHVVWMLVFMVFLLKWCRYEEWIPRYLDWIPDLVFSGSVTLTAMRTRKLPMMFK
ncbi:uncharacterized protein LOC103047594 [Astyanax mexicanus]|uniref:uncharacterized protein LOC103047594 n=1 Tax=Astyanax mexicanus TaxID=7994 RepID=UPI0020CAC946|nr:uncharacterized protein LOC103047594 [Astyanax mexicanus]